MLRELTYLLILNFVFFSSVQAGVFKCTNENGDTIFQDHECKNISHQVILHDQSKGPFGFHSSWFANPRIGSGIASCSETGCTCKELTYEYQQNINTRTLNALHSLPSSWKDYDYKLKRFLKSKKKSSSNESLRGLEKSGCKIAFHQKTIKLYYEEVSKNILDEHEIASTALNDIDRQCQKPSDRGWSDSTNAKRWVNCKSNNQTSHNKAVRLKRKYSAYYYSLMQEQKKLSKPR